MMIIPNIISFIYGLLELLILRLSNKISFLITVFNIMQFISFFVIGYAKYYFGKTTVYHKCKLDWNQIINIGLYEGRPLRIETKEGVIAILHGTEDGFLAYNKEITPEQLSDYYPPGDYILLSCGAPLRNNDIILKYHKFHDDPSSKFGMFTCLIPVSEDTKDIAVFSNNTYDIQRNFYLAYLELKENFDFWEIFKYNFKLIWK